MRLEAGGFRIFHTSN